MDDGGGEDGFDGGGGGAGGDGTGAGFHQNEAISAVQDEEQFYGDEDDYDDLYNDVNVGEGFLQAVPPVHVAVGGVPMEGGERNELPPPPPPLPAANPPERFPVTVEAREPTTQRPVERIGDDGTRAVQPPVRIRAPDLVHNSGGNDGVRSDAGFSGNSNFGNEGYQRQGGNFRNEGFPNQGNNQENEGFLRQGGGYVNGGGGVGTTLFVGDLHWWTTDADLETELCKYGQVKEVKFFEEKASGKSKGFCQVDFYDPMAGTACKEGMNGHLFNGRACVVAFSSPFNVRRMGEQHIRNQQQAMGQSQNQQQNHQQQQQQQQQQPNFAQRGRGSGPPMGGNYGRGVGGGGWGRGGGGMGNRGPMNNNMRNRMGPVGGRGIMGNGSMVAPPQPLLHQGSMLNQGFDPMGYGAAMGRMGGGYGGFPMGPGVSPFPGMPSFTPIVAPHVNPAFFGRGMPAGGVGMWPDVGMGGWVGEEQSSYGEDATSDQHYGEIRGPDRDRSGVPDRRHDRDKDAGSGQDWSGRRDRDDRDRDQERDRERERERERDREKEREREKERDKERDRDRHRDDRDRQGDHYRHRDRELERKDDWDRGRSSRTRSKSREIEHAKRRRPSPD